MKAETLFWQQCTQAVNEDGSIDAEHLMELVIATYRNHESEYGEIERSVETLRHENRELREAVGSATQALAEQRRLFEIVLNNLPLGLSVFDADQRLMLCNLRFRQLFGFTDSDLSPGTTIADLIRKTRGTEHAGAKTGTRRDASGRSAKAGRIRRREWLMDDGRIIQSVVTILADGSNIAIHADITEDRKAGERITYLAHHDALTGLPNRIRFREQLDAALAERKEGEQIALVHLNLDRFKSINNTLGVSAGDTILQQVAERIRSSAGSENTLARLGSDEFAILQTRRQQPWNITALADQIRRELSEPFFRGDKQVELSVSMGISIAPDDATETDRLLRTAAMALSHAKADGRRRERFFTGEMDEEMQARHALEADLRAAVQNEEFELHYQPLYDLTKHRISGFEALIRWNHPVRGRVPPMDFIPLAEEVGLVVDIGRWVLRRACNDAAHWPQDIKIAVNVSAIQFSSSDLPRDVGEALAAAALSPSRLELEITESVLMENLDEALPILHALKERGIRISMDDFGTGYSSLSYLSSFPFDKIKIDKSFVSDIADNREAHAIMHAIILLGDALGMRVTVEGVETAEQMALLEREECDEIQGYFISPPKPLGDVAHLLSMPPKKTGSIARSSRSTADLATLRLIRQAAIQKAGSLRKTVMTMFKAEAFFPHEALAVELVPYATEGDDGSHDLAHILRVFRNAMRIHAAEGGNWRILAAAVLLHDCVAVEKNSPLRAKASALAAEKASGILKELGWGDPEIAAVAHAVTAHSFSANVPPETLEAKILQDADRLDAIGMVGAARCFYIAGRLGSGLYDPFDPAAEDRPLDDKRYAIDHFQTKLFKLADGFQTATGRELAAARDRSLREFLAAFMDEI